MRRGCRGSRRRWRRRTKAKGKSKGKSKGKGKGKGKGKNNSLNAKCAKEERKGRNVRLEPHAGLWWERLRGLSSRMREFW